MLVVAPKIREAIKEGQPVVALETTLIAHGIPRPRNLELAFALEETVKQAGAVPATIGILNGEARIGLNENDIRTIARDNDVLKCSTRDIAGAMAKKALGATTIASTIYLARLAGIRFMATGGLGGVHPGGENSLDISADLGELARSPMAVFCSGPKIILDLARTMEVLETQGVGVIGYGCAKLPGFYLRETEFEIPIVEKAADAAQLVSFHASIGWPGSIIFANPPPKEHAFEPSEFQKILNKANNEARANNITGAKLTPFLLAQIAALSDGRSVTLNEALVLDNAKVASQVAALSASFG